MTQSATTTTGPVVLDVRASRRALVAGSVGNFIEWYDFAVYGYFATVLATQFFPADEGAVGLLKTFGVFAVAFFFRPLGAAVFGRMGDRFGRRRTLALILALMAVSTTAIGLLPTYASVGLLAPVLLVACRVVQGLSAGGEFGGAAALMVEHAPPHRRGFFGSWQSFTVGLGLLAGAGLGALLTSTLAEDALSGWGWRVPFLLGAPLGAVAFYLRMRVDETPHFRRLARGEVTETPTTGPSGAAPELPLWAIVAFSVSTIVAWSCAGYVFLVVMPTYLSTQLEMSLSHSLAAGFVANAAFTVAIPALGLLSDHVGRKPVMLTGAVGVLALSYPMFLLLQTRGTATTLLVMVLAGALVACFAGPGPAMLAELFPTSRRFSGLALGYSLSVAVFGGTAPFVITWLTDATGDPRSAAYYTMAGALVSVIALSRLRDVRGLPLRDV